MPPPVVAIVPLATIAPARRSLRSLRRAERSDRSVASYLRWWGVPPATQTGPSLPLASISTTHTHNIFYPFFPYTYKS